MSQVVVIGALPESLLNFRGDLLMSLVAAGHKVTAMAVQAENTVIEQLALIGVSFRAYPVQRNGLNPIKDVQTFFALFKAFRDLNPDAVLSYTIKPVIWTGFALMRNPVPRYYALVTGLGFAFQEDDFFRKSLTALVSYLYRASLSRASRVIFQNPDNRNLFIARQIVGKDKCALVNGSGIDLNRFTVKRLPVKGVVFLTIGRLLGEKGFREYTKAACLVKAHYPDTLFRLVGPEDPSPDGIPFEEVSDWQAKGWIEYLGETNDVRPFLSDCHIFVLPSYHEGMPRTVLEAMAMGRPIITTNAPGCRETIKLPVGRTLDKLSKEVVQGENGFLVPVKSVEKLVLAMEKFLENPDLIQKMGLRSRKIAEEKFDVYKVNAEIIRVMSLK